MAAFIASCVHLSVISPKIVRVKSSAEKFKKIDVGSRVVVQVPKIDRSPLDQKNLVDKVLKCSNNHYQVGTSHGIISNWL